MIDGCTYTKKIVIIICAVLALAMTILAIFLLPWGTHQPQAQLGVIDLSQGDFSNVLRLDGEWEFYWNTFVTPSDVVTPDLYAQVPSAWNSYTLAGQRLPSQGYATYRLRVKTGLEPGTKMGLQLTSVSSAYAMYVDDTPVASRGTVAVAAGQSRPEDRPQTVSFTLPAPDFVITIQVSNYHRGRGGLWNNVVLGTNAGINAMYSDLGGRQVLFAGILLFVAFTFFCLYVLRRQAREYLYLFMLALVLIPFTDNFYRVLIYRVFPGISYPWLVFFSYASTSWAATLLLLLTAALFPAKWSRQIVRGFVLCTSVLTLAYMLTPVSFYTSYSNILSIYDIAQVIFALYLTIRALAAEVEGSILYLLGLVVVVVAVVHDTLLVNNVIKNGAGQLIYVGIVVMLFVQIMAQAIRSTRTYEGNILLMQRLHSLDRQKDEFLYNTAHHLSWPLNAITALTEELLTSDEVAASQQQQLSGIRTMGNRATRLVREFLDYSLLKRGEIALNLAPVDLTTVIDTVISGFRLADGDRKKSLEVVLPGDLPLVYADEARLYQVLYTIIEKSVQYAHNGIELTAEADSGFVRVRVAGSGEPSLAVTAMLYNYFQEDVNVDDVPSPEVSLLILRQLVALQGGTIAVDVGDGVAVSFTLPIAPGEAVQSWQGAAPQLVWDGEAQELMTIPGQGPHILIVDDNPHDLGATASILGAKGFTITPAPNGRVALDLIKGDPTISLVLLDLIIPGQTGYDICREIRYMRSSHELPILVLTTKTAIGDIVLAFEAGATDFLAKPFERAELLTRVQNLVDLKQSVDKAIASELAFLQAQIKPHFLHNSLSVIASLTISDPQKARDLISDLSDYLRHSFSFSSTEEMVPLAKEIELVQAYVALEKARFGNRLDFQIVADDYPEVSVPRLSMQPLVENAIRHGIYSLPAGGSVLLRIERGLEELHLSVRDSGVGMAQGHVDSLLFTRGTPGVGLANIHKRLRRYYGKGLSIKSTPGQGTTVTFSIPLLSTMRKGGAGN